jgi:hypothetical protein
MLGQKLALELYEQEALTAAAGMRRSGGSSGATTTRTYRMFHNA